MPYYRANIEEQLVPFGYNFLFVHDPAFMADRVRETLGIEVSFAEGGTKIHDFRPTFGHLFASELAGYDWWGHTDMDCVYGRVDLWVTDQILSEVDVFTNDAQGISGPWTLYRNTPEVNMLYQEVQGWRIYLGSRFTTGWVEKAFARKVEKVRVWHESAQAFLPSDLERLQWHGNGLKAYRGPEVMIAHFALTKQYPFALRPGYSG